METESLTLRPTGFGDQGREIATEALYQIYSAVRPSIAGIAGHTWNSFGVEPPDAVDVEFYVEIPDRSAGQFGRALDALDVAWRIAHMAEMDETELPELGGLTNLDEFLPVERFGLTVEQVVVGSLKTWLTDRGVSYDRALATFSVLVTLGGFNAREAFSVEPEQSANGPCQVKIVGQLDADTSKIIQDQLPGLPADCGIRAKILLPDGTIIYAKVPTSALPDS